MEEGHDWAIFGLAGNLSIRDDSPRDGAERSRRGPVDSLLRQELPGDDPLAHRLLSPRLSSTYLAPHGPASRPTSLVSSGDDGDPIAPTTATIIAGAETHGSRSAKTYSPSPRKGLRYHHSVALSLHHHCFYVPSGLALDTPPWEATERKPPHCTSPRLSDYAIHPATPVHPNRLGFLPVGQATCSVKARHQQEPRHGGPSAAVLFPIHPPTPPVALCLGGVIVIGSWDPVVFGGEVGGPCRLRVLASPGGGFRRVYG